MPQIVKVIYLAINGNRSPFVFLLLTFILNGKVSKLHINLTFNLKGGIAMIVPQNI
jgi:hypothetical protein